MATADIVKKVNEYTRPKILDIEIEGQKMFLELAGLKIGDEVDCVFNYSHGTSKQSYLTSRVKKGIITVLDNGSIAVISKEPLPESRNYSSGRRSWWEYPLKHQTETLSKIVLTDKSTIK